MSMNALRPDQFTDLINDLTALSRNISFCNAAREITLLNLNTLVNVPADRLFVAVRCSVPRTHRKIYL